MYSNVCQPSGFRSILASLHCACPSDYRVSSKHLTGVILPCWQYLIKTPESFQKIDRVENTVTLCNLFLFVPQDLALILLYIQAFHTALHQQFPNLILMLIIRNCDKASYFASDKTSRLDWTCSLQILWHWGRYCPANSTVSFTHPSRCVCSSFWKVNQLSSSSVTLGGKKKSSTTHSIHRLNKLWLFLAV